MIAFIQDFSTILTEDCVKIVYAHATLRTGGTGVLIAVQNTYQVFPSLASCLLWSATSLIKPFAGIFDDLLQNTGQVTKLRVKTPPPIGRLASKGRRLGKSLDLITASVWYLISRNRAPGKMVKKKRSKQKDRNRKIYLDVKLWVFCTSYKIWFCHKENEIYH